MSLSNLPPRLRPVRLLPFPTAKREYHVADWNQEARKFRRIFGIA